MEKLTAITRQFRDDESGAAMVEYSILVGIIAGAAILAILAIGGWVSGRFVGLCGKMQGSGIGSCDAAGGTGN
ncbi:Flp family type IVb pilin [Mesorhizobium sp. B3-2-1]|uniref:Flp family type IVb pilin n=1 Tax=Mesorhizobium sp. B3-2-1 TaxID=2589891 RepID=UPI00112EEE36|nr:Flp family type IVb pilin [Mesorhizobium sp. B3-2-1]TPI35043.1 Flp family type IVb pilin [Mesorhizobium sp. B3-2-1]